MYEVLSWKNNFVLTRPFLSNFANFWSISRCPKDKARRYVSWETLIWSRNSGFGASANKNLYFSFMFLNSTGKEKPTRELQNHPKPQWKGEAISHVMIMYLHVAPMPRQALLPLAVYKSCRRDQSCRLKHISFMDLFIQKHDWMSTLINISASSWRQMNRPRKEQRHEQKLKAWYGTQWQNIGQVTERTGRP